MLQFRLLRHLHVAATVSETEELLETGGQILRTAALHINGLLLRFRGYRDVDDSRSHARGERLHRVIHRCQCCDAIIVQWGDGFCRDGHVVLVNEETGAYDRKSS
jgi:hypothetical protein